MRRYIAVFALAFFSVLAYAACIGVMGASVALAIGRALGLF